MKEFNGKVAVITGAASGIGQGLATRCVQEGMRVVLADIDAGALAQAEQALRAGGAQTIAVRMDVTRPEDWDRLARQAQEAFGAVDLFFNNAGVGGGGRVWERSLADWQWIMDVNLWGPIHGVRTFVPLMLAQGTPGHIVNTASIVGHLAKVGPYSVTKFGVVALSESLRDDLAAMNALLKVSVLCPGWVKTGILNSERVRPEAYRDPSAGPAPSAESVENRWAQIAGEMKVISPAVLAEGVFAALREERFYIMTDLVYKDNIIKRMLEVVNARNVIAG